MRGDRARDERRARDPEADRGERGASRAGSRTRRQPITARSSRGGSGARRGETSDGAATGTACVTCTGIHSHWHPLVYTADDTV